MSFRQRFAIIVLIVGSCLCVGGYSRSEPPNQVSTFMRKKLVHTQAIVEGLVTEDFERLAKHSQDLSLLSREVSWNVLQTEEYSDRSRDFRKSVDALTKSANEKNLDGATLAYVDVTLKCVACHKYIRNHARGTVKAK